MITISTDAIDKINEGIIISLPISFKQNANIPNGIPINAAGLHILGSTVRVL
jgi:hypothetical protein